METGTLIIALVCILAFAIPIIILNRKGKGSEKKMIDILRKHVVENKFTLDRWERERDLLLGVDFSNRIAFFVDLKNEGNDNFEFVDLNHIQICKVDRQVRNVKTSHGTDSEIQKLSICFYPKSKKSTMECFTLFDEANNRELGNELLLAKKWVDIFNQRVK